MVCAAVLAGPYASAQDGTSWRERLRPEVAAGAFVRRVSVDIEGTNAASTQGLLVQAGLRVRPFALFCRTSRCAASRVQITPNFQLGATHLRGITDEPGKGSFATAEAGARLGVLVHSKVVPFVTGAFGTHSTEQYEGQVANLWGRGASVGVGVALPWTRLGRGLELALVQHRGDFTKREILNAARTEKAITDINRSFSGWSLAVGWSGPFTGVTWPWQ
jgi:hypothetical protein